jgi:hypothetical protein
MKIKVAELRQLINEEFMRGVPEYILHDATHKYIETIRLYLQRHIAMTQKDPVGQRETIELANQVLEKLEKTVNQNCEDSLWQFLQRT